MRKRLTTCAAALTAAVAIAGCGSGTGSATGDALSFMPKDAPFVMALETDPDGDQYKQLDKLLGKFPFGGQVKSQLKQSVRSEGYDFDKDIKPILGNDFVLTFSALQEDDPPALGAMKVNDEGKAEALVKKDASKVGSAEGSDIYKSGGDTFLALKDEVLVVADSTQDLEAALKRHGGDDHMTEDDFDARLAGVEGDGILRYGLNIQALLAASPGGERLRKQRWFAAARDTGTVVSAKPDGIEIESKLTTEGATERDLPLAPGAEAAPVVRRATDINVGVRDVARAVPFFEDIGEAVAPAKFARYERRKRKLGKALGIDVDRDVIAQFNGDTSLSIGIDGGFAMRSELKDPNAFRATLKKATPKLKKALRDEHVGIVVPKKPNGFYAAATAKGKKFAFAVIGNRFVLGTDPARAAQFAAQSPSSVPGARGSFVIAMDARALANAIAAEQGVKGAGLFTGSLGDFIGWAESDTSGQTSKFKLTVK